MSDRIFRHTITPGLCMVLTKIGEAVARKGENKVHIPRDLDLSDLSENDKFSLHGNYSKLRFFGLIHHYKNELGLREAGYWLLTRNGARFLKNQLPIPRTVKTLNNEIIERDIAKVFISNVWEDYRLYGEKFQSLWLGEETEPAEQGQLVMSLF